MEEHNLLKTPVVYVTQKDGQPISCIGSSWSDKNGHWKHGWCQVESPFVIEESWGICSPSCNTALMKVARYYIKQCISVFLLF